MVIGDFINVQNLCICTGTRTVLVYTHMHGYTNHAHPVHKYSIIIHFVSHSCLIHIATLLWYSNHLHNAIRLRGTSI